MLLYVRKAGTWALIHSRSEPTAIQLLPSGYLPSDTAQECLGFSSQAAELLCRGPATQAAWD